MGTYSNDVKIFAVCRYKNVSTIGVVLGTGAIFTSSARLRTFASRAASFHTTQRTAFLRTGGTESRLRLLYSRMNSIQRQDNSFTADCNEAEENSLRRGLYAPLETYSTGDLKVSGVHTLYWEQSGNPSGYPVLFLHGGPGAGTSSSNRRFFDPSFYRIVLLDQRGAGKSTPHACLEENTTWDLVEDIEKLRKHLDIQEWLVFGGSWGSTLSLAYAQSYPEHVTGLILRGIFLIRKKEIEWYYEGGASALFPDVWEDYRDLIPVDERENFVAAYSKRLKSSNPAVQLAASKAWTNWEMSTSYLLPNEESLKRGDDDKFSLAFACIENHYFINKGFFPTDSFLLDNVDKIRHIPAVIIQGRYDVVCPMMSAWDLHKAWPEATFKVVLNAGHSANEADTTAELVAATESFKKVLGRK